MLAARRTNAKDIGIALRLMRIAQRPRAAVAPGAIVHREGAIAQILDHGNAIGSSISQARPLEVAGN